MIDELENLRPEVREAVGCVDSCFTIKLPYRETFMDDSWQTVRAELLRLAGVEAELAMLKAKIADAPIASVRVDDRMHVSIGARSCAVDFVPLHTKRVRLVVEE